MEVAILCLCIYYSATHLRQGMYYMLLESYFRGASGAVKIVGISSGEAEIFELQVGSIELGRKF